MKKLLTIFAVLATLASACPPLKVKGLPDQIIQKDDWVLKIWVTAKGTRSQGHVSHLYHNGKEICPRNGINKIDTPLGKLQYVKGKMPWNWRGWKPLNKKRFLLIAP